MENYTNRKEYIGKLMSYKDKDLIKVVSGLRRSGKSTLLELYREALLKLDIGKRQIQFYNFELPENFVNKNWDDIYFDIKRKLQSDKPNYVFLDEVQNIPFLKNWWTDFLLPKMWTFTSQGQTLFYCQEN